MTFVNEFHDPAIARSISERIARSSTKPVQFMEFCGSHTHALLRHGIRDLLPPSITMRSGPGCPVCVTSAHDIDMAIALAMTPGVIVATYGDLVRVPGSRGSLEHARAAGADIRVVYSARDAITIAEQNPSRPVILIGIGFETTAPTVAVSVLEASQRQLRNYHILSLLKVTPPVTQALLSLGEVHIDGIICPGHVSVVIGTKPYESLPIRFGVGCAVAGFEPLDILRAIELLVQQYESGTPSVANAYTRAVTPEGNKAAQEYIQRVFTPCTADWRGIGMVPLSGLGVRREFERFDALALFKPDVPPATEPPGCRCGDVLRGSLLPSDCPLFGGACSPQHPVGPCMVSQEGACAAHFAYQLNA